MYRAGIFHRFEDAVRSLVDDRIVADEIVSSDMSWARSDVDEGLAAFERGETITLDEYKALNKTRFATTTR